MMLNFPKPRRGEILHLRSFQDFKFAKYLQSFQPSKFLGAHIHTTYLQWQIISNILQIHRQNVYCFIDVIMSSTSKQPFLKTHNQKLKLISGRQKIEAMFSLQLYIFIL